MTRNKKLLTAAAAAALVLTPVTALLPGPGCISGASGCSSYG
jgi:hypothetical protein